MQSSTIPNLFLIACTTALMLGTPHLQADCAEVGYIATFDIKPGSEAVFEKAIVEVATKVLEMEPGTLLYTPYHAEGTRYYMLERYQDLAARELHAKAPEVLAMFPPVMATLAAPIDVTPITAVCATERQKETP
jgi:quinol monooxygenase YgiN